MTQCIAPVVVKKNHRKSSKDYATDVFPCGKCPPCVKRRVSAWVFRLDEERKVSFSSTFLTLTYEDPQLPYSENGLPTLDKTHFQKFMKRLRKYLTQNGHDYKLKYYTAGEYGTRTHRPHYHSILFNLPHSMLGDPCKLQDIWSHGGIYIGDCNAASIAYTAGYCLKKSAPVERHEADDRIPEFSLMSKGMGIDYLTEKKKAYYTRVLEPYARIEDGQKISMPRYFKDKMYTEAQREVINRKALEHIEKQQPPSNEWKKFQFFKAKLKARDSRGKI